MNKQLLSLILLLVALIGCREAVHLKDVPYVPGAHFEMKVTGAKATELTNLLANMRIFLFTRDAGDTKGILKHEILNLDKIGADHKVLATITSEHVPAGEWTMVAISNLSSSDKISKFEAKYAKSRDQLLYQFTPGVLNDVGVYKGSNCPEIVVLTKDIVVRGDGVNQVITAMFKRAVAKVKVTIVSTSGNIKKNSTSHMVEIVDVGSHLSLYGGLLKVDASGNIGAPDRQNHAVLDSTVNPMRRSIDIHSSVAPTPPTGSILAFPFAEFIVPAYDDLASNAVTVPSGSMSHKHNKFLRLNVDLETESPAGRYKNSVVVDKASLSANMSLHIKLNVTAELTATVEIEEWGAIGVDSDIIGTKISGKSKVLMDYASLAEKFESGDVKYESDGVIKINIGGSDVELPTVVGGKVDLMSRLPANVTSWLTGATWTHDQTVTVVAEGVPAKSAKGHLNFTYKISGAADKGNCVIDLLTGNVTKRVKVVYDNGLISSEVLKSEAATFIPEGGSGVNRNYWGLVGFHLSKRGWNGHNSGVAAASATKGIDPFTDSTTATAMSAGVGGKVGDGKALWQSPSVATGLTSKLFNTGKSHTAQMGAASSGTYAAAKYCLNTGHQYYLPGVSELKWIQQHGNAYLGDSYKFSSDAYWSSTESSNTNSYSVGNSIASGVSSKTTSLSVRCIQDPFEMKPAKSVEGFYTGANHSDRMNGTVLTGFDVHDLLDVTASTHTITSVTSTFNQHWDAVITTSKAAPSSKPNVLYWNKADNGMVINSSKVYFYPFRTSPGEADIIGSLWVTGTLVSGGKFAYGLPLTIVTSCKLPTKADNYAVQINAFKVADRNVGSKLPTGGLYEVTDKYFTNKVGHPDYIAGSTTGGGTWNTWKPQKADIAAIAGEYYSQYNAPKACAEFTLGTNKWRLPNGTSSSGEVKEMLKQTRFSKYRVFLLSTVTTEGASPGSLEYSGVLLPMIGHSLNPENEGSLCWSTVSRYYLNIYSTGANVYNMDSGYGFSARCVGVVAR